MPATSAPSTSLRRMLPRGRTLPADAWARRHRWLLVILGLHAVVLPLYAKATGYGAIHAVLHGLPLLACLLIGLRVRDRRVASSAVALGLLSASAVAVHTSGGIIEAHFHFFVMIVLLALYEDWMPFLLAVGYVVVHHGLGGVLAPHDVYANPDAVAHPWKWAGIHGAFVLAASAGAVASWRLNEDVRDAAVQSEEHFRRIFEDAPIGMAVTSLDGRWVQVNRSLCELVGLEAEQMVGRPISDLTHPDDRAHVRADIAALLSAARCRSSCARSATCTRAARRSTS